MFCLLALESGTQSQEQSLSGGPSINRALTVPDLVQFGKTRENIVHRQVAFIVYLTDFVPKKVIFDMSVRTLSRD